MGSVVDTRPPGLPPGPARVTAGPAHPPTHPHMASEGPTFRCVYEGRSAPRGGDVTCFPKCLLEFIVLFGLQERGKKWPLIMTCHHFFFFNHEFKL